jgi:hypothetical protein
MGIHLSNIGIEKDSDKRYILGILYWNTSKVILELISRKGVNSTFIVFPTTAELWQYQCWLCEK